MTEAGDRNVLDCPDLDREIFRTVSMDRFLAILVNKKDSLSRPGNWEDPFEDLLFSNTLVRDGTNPPISLKNFAEEWYGQCWSLHAETDAMWRLYSPEKRGVRMRSTIRRVFENLKNAGLAKDESRECFVGAVNYLTETQIAAMMASTTFLDISLGGQNDAFARLLCIKRDQFEHEAEVRLLYDDGRVKSAAASNGYVSFAFDPSVVLLGDVLLDPRLKPHEFDGFKKVIEALSWGAGVTRSKMYDTPKYTIDIQ